MNKQVSIIWLLLCLSILVTPLLPPTSSGLGFIYLSSFYIAGMVFLVIAFARLKKYQSNIILIVAFGFVLAIFYYVINLKLSSFQGPFLLTILLAASLQQEKLCIRRIVISERDVSAIAMIILAIFILSMRTIEGRQASFTGDPNHTAALFIFPTLLLVTYSKKIKQIIFLYSLAFFYSLLTISRGGFIAVIAYIFYKHFVGRFKKSHRIYILVLATTLLIGMEFIFYLLFIDALSDSSAGRSMTGFFDQSNFGRVSSFGYAIPYLFKSVETFLFGSQEYWQKSLEFSVVLHHGFLEFALHSGVPLVLFIVYLAGVLAVKSSVDHEAYFVSLVIIGAHLSSVIFSFPIFIMIISCAYQRKVDRILRFPK